MWVGIELTGFVWGTQLFIGYLDLVVRRKPWSLSIFVTVGLIPKLSSDESEVLYRRNSNEALDLSSVSRHSNDLFKPFISTFGLTKKAYYPLFVCIYHYYEPSHNYVLPLSNDLIA